MDQQRRRKIANDAPVAQLDRSSALNSDTMYWADPEVRYPVFYQPLPLRYYTDRFLTRTHRWAQLWRQNYYDDCYMDGWIAETYRPKRPRRQPFLPSTLMWINLMVIRLLQYPGDRDVQDKLQEVVVNEVGTSGNPTGLDGLFDFPEWLRHAKDYWAWRIRNGQLPIDVPDHADQMDRDVYELQLDDMVDRLFDWRRLPLSTVQIRGFVQVFSWARWPRSCSVVEVTPPGHVTRRFRR